MGLRVPVPLSSCLLETHRSICCVAGSVIGAADGRIGEEAHSEELTLWQRDEIENEQRNKIISDFYKCSDRKPAWCSSAWWHWGMGEGS